MTRTQKTSVLMQPSIDCGLLAPVSLFVPDAKWGQKSQNGPKLRPNHTCQGQSVISVLYVSVD